MERYASVHSAAEISWPTLPSLPSLSLPPSLSQVYLPSSSVGGNPFASLCIIVWLKFCDMVWKELAAQVQGWSRPGRKPFANELLVSHARHRFCSRICPIVTEPKIWRSLTNHGMEEHGGDGDGRRRGARVQFSPPPRARPPLAVRFLIRATASEDVENIFLRITEKWQSAITRSQENRIPRYPPQPRRVLWRSGVERGGSLSLI